MEQKIIEQDVMLTRQLPEVNTEEICDVTDFVVDGVASQPNFSLKLGSKAPSQCLARSHGRDLGHISIPL